MQPRYDVHCIAHIRFCFKPTCSDESSVALSWHTSSVKGGVCMMRRKRSNCPRSKLRLIAQKEDNCENGDAAGGVHPIHTCSNQLLRTCKQLIRTCKQVFHRCPRLSRTCIHLNVRCIKITAQVRDNNYAGCYRKVTIHILKVVLALQ